jgi:hypothetical protein
MDKANVVASGHCSSRIHLGRSTAPAFHHATPTLTTNNLPGPAVVKHVSCTSERNFMNTYEMSQRIVPKLKELAKLQ